MVPYLGAIGLMDSADLALAQRALLLLGYCLVMIVPALVLVDAECRRDDRVDRGHRGLPPGGERRGHARLVDAVDRWSARGG
jgi:hypothetical protein